MDEHESKSLEDTVCSTLARLLNWAFDSISLGRLVFGREKRDCFMIIIADLFSSF